MLKNLIALWAKDKAVPEETYSIDPGYEGSRAELPFAFSKSRLRAYDLLMPVDNLNEGPLSGLEIRFALKVIITSDDGSCVSQEVSGSCSRYWCGDKGFGLCRLPEEMRGKSGRIEVVVTKADPKFASRYGQARLTVGGFVPK